MSIKVKNDSARRFISVQKGSLLCERLELRDKLAFQTHDTWCALFNTKSHRRKIRTIERIDDWVQWYIPKKLNCEAWYCSKQKKCKLLKKYTDWVYTIIYIVEDEL